jgi:hypothetical protein
MKRLLWLAGAAKLLRGFSPEQQTVIEEGLRSIAQIGDRLFEQNISAPKMRGKLWQDKCKDFTKTMIYRLLLPYL